MGASGTTSACAENTHPQLPGGGTCGTTSACAENTIAGRNRPRRRGNYLRVRGEYSSSPITPVTRSELPPRARRILPRQGGEGVEEGTTSACAENTARRVFPAPLGRNYLRVRGEYTVLYLCGVWHVELPPRARRIQKMVDREIFHIGTTSACAENTGNSPKQFHGWWNYLRVRGEYPALWPR